MPYRGVCGWLAGALIGFLLIPGGGSASVRSLYRDPGELFLHEKIGRPENMLDNPARLLAMQQYLVSEEASVQIQDTQPVDAVYAKHTYQENIANCVQTILPLDAHLVLNAGYQYFQALAGSRSEAVNDQTIIQDLAKTIGRQFNAAVGWQEFIPIPVGYSFSSNQSENFTEYYSRQESTGIQYGEYQYFNGLQTMRHGAGMCLEDWELYGSWSRRVYTGNYAQHQEIEFNITELQMQARRQWTWFSPRDLLTRVGYSNSQLTTPRFERAREYYYLTAPLASWDAAAYLQYPWAGGIAMAGLEVMQQEQQLFDIYPYQWITYQTMEISLPVEFFTEILPGWRVWVEMALAYAHDSYTRTEAWRLAADWGLQYHQNQWEINLRTIPSLDWVRSNKKAGGETIKLFVDGVYRF